MQIEHLTKSELKPSILNHDVQQVLLHNLKKHVFRSRLGATLENFLMILRHLFVHFVFLVGFVNKDNQFLLITERYA